MGFIEFPRPLYKENRGKKNVATGRNTGKYKDKDLRAKTLQGDHAQ